VRGILAILCVGVCALPLTSEAHPPTPIKQGSKPLRGKLHRWVHQSRAPLFRGRLQILRLPCPANPRYGGCVGSRRPRRIYLHPRAAQPRAVLYHEIGHVFDLVVLNRSDRRQFKRIMGIRRGGWFRGSPGPSELLADAYAACSFHRRIGRVLRRTSYGYRASPRRHVRICALLRRAAAPKGRPPQRPPNPPPVVDQAPPPKPPATTPPSGQQPEPCSLLETLLGGC